MAAINRLIGANMAKDKVKVVNRVVFSPEIEVIKNKIRLVETLEFPLDITSRLQSLAALNSFAIETKTTVPKMNIYDYQQSVSTFASTKGEILKKLFDRLHNSIERDIKVAREHHLIDKGF